MQMLVTPAEDGDGASGGSAQHKTHVGTDSLRRKHEI